MYWCNLFSLCDPAAGCFYAVNSQGYWRILVIGCGTLKANSRPHLLNPTTHFCCDEASHLPHEVSVLQIRFKDELSFALEAVSRGVEVLTSKQVADHDHVGETRNSAGSDIPYCCWTQFKTQRDKGPRQPTKTDPPRGSYFCSLDTQQRVTKINPFLSLPTKQ